MLQEVKLVLFVATNFAFNLIVLNFRIKYENLHKCNVYKNC